MNVSLSEVEGSVNRNEASTPLSLTKQYKKSSLKVQNFERAL